MADGRPARMQQVEVDDPGSDGVRSAAGGPAGLPAEVGGAPLVALRRWWWVAALAVVAVAVAVLVGESRDRAFVERVSAVPGLVRPLDGAPTHVWKAPSVLAAQGVTPSGDSLVLATDEQAGLMVTSHDAATGAVRWQVPVGPPQRAGYESGSTWCPSDGSDVGPVLLCVVTRPGVVYARGAIGEERLRLSVVALAAADGHRLGGWDAPTAMLDVARVQDDLVIGSVDRAGHLAVARFDGVTGEVVWTYRGRDALREETRRLLAGVRTDGPFVVVDDTSTTVLDVTDGHVLLSGPRLEQLRFSRVRDRFATWASTQGGRLYDRDGVPLFAVPGLAAHPSVDDDTVDDVVAVQGSTTLSGVSARTGERLWSSAGGLDVDLVVSGRFVVAGPGRYGVVDPSDGRLVWVVDAGVQVPWGLVSDGALVIGPGVDDAGEPLLVGTGIRDGVRAWAVPLPRDVLRVEAVEGSLVVRTSDETLVLR